MPVFVIAWGSEGPANELDGIVKAEGAFTVLYVVLLQQFIDFFYLAIICNVNSGPLKSSRENIWL